MFFQSNIFPIKLPPISINFPNKELYPISKNIKNPYKTAINQRNKKILWVTFIMLL